MWERLEEGSICLPSRKIKLPIRFLDPPLPSTRKQKIKEIMQRPEEQNRPTVVQRDENSLQHIATGLFQKKIASQLSNPHLRVSRTLKLQSQG
jgi:hypothetical protein